ncbi:MULTISPECIES: hypothetical protein [Rhodococcus]|uniref:hypothetical protein n=1 Tax=Rhodococcus TaxID=1827 RepID=UPI0023E258AF|nr:hypothetical protein [Rhodococcus sp. T2V]MDF3312611.1 hypothetical protein [Rhodococcus sp. T2V]
MKFREQLASGIGVLGLAIDAGIALMSMVIAVPVAFAVGEIGKGRVQVRGQAPRTVPPESSTHELGTVVTYR